jgi:hypothetical protein
MDIGKNMTATKPVIDLLGNTGELTYATLNTEQELFTWLKDKLVPSLQNIDWLDYPGIDELLRENCQTYNSDQDCIQSVNPHWDNKKHRFAVPSEYRLGIRKYNRIVGGVRIDQRRALWGACDSKHDVSLADELLGKLPFISTKNNYPGFDAARFFVDPWVPGGNDGYRKPVENQAAGAPYLCYDDTILTDAKLNTRYKENDVTDNLFGTVKVGGTRAPSVQFSKLYDRRFESELTAISKHFAADGANKDLNANAGELQKLVTVKQLRSTATLHLRQAVRAGIWWPGKTEPVSGWLSAGQLLAKKLECDGCPNEDSPCCTLVDNFRLHLKESNTTHVENQLAIMEFFDGGNPTQRQQWVEKLWVHKLMDTGVYKANDLQKKAQLLALNTTVHYLKEPFEQLWAEPGWQDTDNNRLCIMDNDNYCSERFAMLELINSALQTARLPNYRMYLDLSDSEERLQSYLSFVQRHGWIDEATREVTVSFIVFNPSLAVISLFVINFELSTAGTIEHVVTALPFRVSSCFYAKQNLTRFVIEILVLLFNLYFVAREISEVCGRYNTMRRKVIGKRQEGHGTEQAWIYNLRSYSPGHPVFEAKISDGTDDSTGEETIHERLQRVRYIRVAPDGVAGLIPSGKVWTESAASLQLPVVADFDNSILSPIPGFFWQDGDRVWRFGEPRPTRTEVPNAQVACGVPDLEIKKGDVINVAGGFRLTENNCARKRVMVVEQPKMRFSCTRAITCCSWYGVEAKYYALADVQVFREPRFDEEAEYKNGHTELEQFDELRQQDVSVLQQKVGTMVAAGILTKQMLQDALGSRDPHAALVGLIDPVLGVIPAGTILCSSQCDQGVFQIHDHHVGRNLRVGHGYRRWLQVPRRNHSVLWNTPEKKSGDVWVPLTDDTGAVSLVYSEKPRRLTACKLKMCCRPQTWEYQVKEVSNELFTKEKTVANLPWQTHSWHQPVPGVRKGFSLDAETGEEGTFFKEDTIFSLQCQYSAIVKFGLVKKVDVRPQFKNSNATNGSLAFVSTDVNYGAEGTYSAGGVEPDCHDFIEGELADRQHPASICESITEHFSEAANVLDLVVHVYFIYCLIKWWTICRSVVEYFNDNPLKADYDVYETSGLGTDQGLELDRLFVAMKWITDLFNGYRTMVAVQICAGIMQAFRHLRDFDPSIKIIINTLIHSIGDVVYFLVVFLMLVVAIACALNFVAGHTLPTLKSLPKSTLAVVDILCGDWDRSQIDTTTGMTGGGLMVLYYIVQMLLNWVLLNVFIAIVSGKYEDEKTEFANKKENQVTDSILKEFRPGSSSRGYRLFRPSECVDFLNILLLECRLRGYYQSHEGHTNYLVACASGSHCKAQTSAGQSPGEIRKDAIYWRGFERSDRQLLEKTYCNQCYESKLHSTDIGTRTAYRGFEICCCNDTEVECSLSELKRTFRRSCITLTKKEQESFGKWVHGTLDGWKRNGNLDGANLVDVREALTVREWIVDVNIFNKTRVAKGVNFTIEAVKEKLGSGAQGAQIGKESVCPDETKTLW